MKQMICLLLAGFAICGRPVQAQQTETKIYTNVWGGQVDMVYNWGELRTSTATDKVFTINARTTDYYYLKALANRQDGEKLQLMINGVSIATLYPLERGWQWLGNGLPAIKLAKGKNEIRFMGTSLAVPMVEEISLTYYDPWARTAPVTAGDRFIETMTALKQQPAGKFKTVAEAGDMTEKVLPNPAGNYDHAIDTQFSYSHFSWIYLNAGWHEFYTSGSTIMRSLSIFNPATYAISSSNITGNAAGESYLNILVSQAGYHAVMLQPYTDGQTGTTNIIYNGSTLVTNASIGGRRLAMSALKGGDLNHFTCRLSGSNADTRMTVSRSVLGNVRGYNDDYSSSGNWIWGRASRIKKNFNGLDSVRYGFVCAYSPSATGVCDIYLGNLNSNVYNTNYPEFPDLLADDAIMTAPSTGMYNCIAWSGGITTNWIWPPGSLSTYSCTSANYLQCFDNFYSNNPVRYPGAWNYTRTGATVSNSVVDLWKQPSGGYQHASVRKPGNNNPHGYDWESKPGGTARTLHPRYALNNVNWYGLVNDYYRPTGTYARTAGSGEFYATDADAVKAGVAVFDVAALTRGAQDKLGKLLQQTDPAFVRQFNELYAAWDKTKAANSTKSDPSAYCQNKEHEALAAMSKTNAFATLVLVMDKFVNGNDHFMGDLLVALSREKYGKLLDEVKAERLAKPADEQGRHKIHGDHDNGVLYVEKILAALDVNTEIKPLVETVTVTASPNPVKYRLTVTVNITAAARVSVKATSAQTRNSKVLQQEKVFAAGTYQFSLSTLGLAGGTGDIITIQVMVDGVVKTVKVLVGN